MESLYNMIVSGLSNYDILNQNPDYIPYLDKINQVRLVVNQEQSKSEWRDLETIYVFGETGLGKTRTIMEKHGYSNVFRVTDYQHPFDTYENQDIILFEEFSSSLRIQDMLYYLDGYPLKLPARYSDKHACYTKVYLTSNLDLDEQYQNIQRYEPSVWKAFLRRIHKVRKYINTNQYLEFTTEHYINGFHPAEPKNTPFPSDSKSAADAESYKQELLELTGNNNTSKEPRKAV
jgi:hypothetical protein